MVVVSFLWSAHLVFSLASLNVVKCRVRDRPGSEQSGNGSYKLTCRDLNPLAK